MNFKVTSEEFDQIDANCEVIITDDLEDCKDKELLKKLDFKPQEEDILHLPELSKLYIGVEKFEDEDIKIAMASLYKAIKNRGYKSIKIRLEGKEKAIVEGLILGSYRFEKYKSKKDKESLKSIYISVKKEDIKRVKEIVKTTKIIAQATNEAKEIVNTSPADITPQALADYAKNLAKEIENLECFIGDEKFLEKENMGAFLAVARASSNPPRLIHLTYKPKNAKKKIALVGKGLTYDSGGLSLKPSDYMVTMKSDKSGASAVLHIVKAIALLKLPLEVHAIVGAAENMIGGNAYKPDDVLKARNGKTIEVRNTDAEGRLVLADCLDYAQDLEPDYLFDFATLTGACVVALGEYTSGVMGHSSHLKHSFVSTALKSGELVGTLPFNRYLKKLLKSSVADISNISSSRYGGAITAALFLDNFIKEEYKQKWLHIDIAGPAYVEKEWGYNQFGASGAGVRMCVEWCIKKSKEEDK